MSIGVDKAHLLRRTVLLTIALLAAAMMSTQVGAQVTTTTATNTQVFNIVGGVLVNPDGILNNANRDQIGKLTEMHREVLEAIPDALNQTAGLRKVSLRKLEAVIRGCIEQGKRPPDSVLLLAGLQRIEYVFYYPEQKDIVLVGRAEGWRLDAQGNYVGVKSGRPVMLLDDLLVALRTALGTPSVLSCSINPTPEGMRRVENFMRQARGASRQDVAAGMQEQLGPQKVTIFGVPGTSHFARTMVAADYRMKRVSLALDPSPVKGLPSYMDMMKGPAKRNVMPRWWLEPDYSPLLRDDAGLAWEMRGATVRCKTESDLFDANGVAHPTGDADPISKRWADLMTGHYDELAKADPVFGQLRNCMDLAVVGALVAKQQRIVKAGDAFPLLAGEEGGLLPVALAQPKEVATGATLAAKSRKTVIAAGGVQFNPWAALEKVEKKVELAQDRSKAIGPDGASWWWD